MDFDITMKEKVLQPKGAVEMLVSNIFDFKLKERKDSEGVTLIDDIEVLDDEEDNGTAEMKDRVVFAVLRQRGQDPLAPLEGCQWSEAMLGEIPVALLMNQVVSAGRDENSSITVTFSSENVGGEQKLYVNFSQIV